MHLIIHFSYAWGQVSSWTTGPGPSGENMWKLAWAHGEVRHMFCSILLVLNYSFISVINSKTNKFPYFRLKVIILIICQLIKCCNSVFVIMCMCDCVCVCSCTCSLHLYLFCFI